MLVKETDILAKRLGLDTPDQALYFPKYLQIETVALCNARCVMCTIGNWKRRVSIMQQDLFDKILGDLAPFSGWIERVTIQLEGEPLIDKDLEKRIRALKNIGIKCVAFASNASLMNVKRAESIILSGVDVIDFSIDGATAKTFEAIRKKLDFGTCVTNIENFINIRNKLKPDLTIRIRMTIQKENAHEFNEFISFWKKRLSRNDRVYGKSVQIWKESLKGQVSTFGQEHMNRDLYPCVSPWSSFLILTDGRVPLCCCDYNADILAGNVKSESIQKIWQGRVFKGVRQLQLSKGRAAMNICNGCTVWDQIPRAGFKNDAVGI